MPLDAGTQLGPYEIVAPIGAGGMGEVYKARDTRLDRTVAIKVLPEHVAADPDLKQRFEREAKTISSLNHPHICTLYDVGQHDGIDFLVMEYLEGDTLAQRLEKGALPLDQALQVAIEIADALDKAHRQGIVHRDLKPCNIMLTKSGAKLLDFGLAKLKGPDQAAGGLTALPTQDVPLTQQGAILGTFQYMAPEQLEGQEADPRADIFALGAVIYEMVAGRKAFEGKSQASLISAIMTADPPALASLQPMSPPVLDQIVATCLAKDPESRWHSAGDVERQLTWIVEGGADPGGAAPTVPAAPVRFRIWQRPIPIVVAAVTLAAIAGVAGWVLKQAPPSPRPLVRFAMTPPADWLGISTESPDLTISPDGTQIVNLAGFRTGLVIRPLAQLEATPQPDLGRVAAPFMSPDSASIGFRSSTTGGSSLERVSVFGGPSVTICPLPAGLYGFGASWGANDTIIFGTTRPGGLRRVSAGGGEPEELTTPNAELGEVSHEWPDILPGGRAVLFTIIPAGSIENARIAVLDLETGVQTVLIPGGSSPRYSPTGHLVYAVDGTLRAVGFDLERLEVTTNPLPVVDGVLTKTSGTANFSFSRDGTLVYVPDTGVGGSGARGTLVWVDREGREEPLGLPPGGYVWPRVSPDGGRVAVRIRGPENMDVWTSDVARGTLSILTPDPAADRAPLWTLDGDRVVFVSEREPQGLFWKAADGSGTAEPLLTGVDVPRSLAPSDWSSTGNALVVNYLAPDTGYDIGVSSLWRVSGPGNRS